MKIVIAGVVGAGKSTVSMELAKKMQFQLLEEPVATNPYLDDFYANPKDYAFKMQIFMLMTRSKQLKIAQSSKNVIFDRSILEDQIFVEVLKAQNNIDERDYQTYYDFYNHIITSAIYFDPQIKPDLIVYLRVSTKIAIERIKIRGRDSEKKVSSSYWELLNQQYETWYFQQKKQLPFLVINTDNNSVADIIAIIIAKVREMNN